MPKRRGIMIQKNVKPKPKIKVEKQNLSNILSQGASKNKQEMEALLSTHGGGFKTDFGLRGTIDFGEETKNDGWNRLFGYINGTIKDERIDDAIEQRRLFKDQKHFQKKKLEPINPKVPTSPESLTDITKVFLDKMKQQKKTKKTKKIKQIKLVKNFKQKKKVTRNRPDFVTPPPKLNNTLNIQY